MAYDISRKSPIGELVLNAPSAAAVLLEHGFHCIGCGLAAYETLEEGAAAHGFDDAAIDALVLKLQEAAKKEEEMLNRLSDSPAAKAAEAKAAQARGIKKNKITGAQAATKSKKSKSG
jgi:hybrid cluster-associated redox disulfide protein